MTASSFLTQAATRQQLCRPIFETDVSVAALKSSVLVDDTSISSGSECDMDISDDNDEEAKFFSLEEMNKTIQSQLENSQVFPPEIPVKQEVGKLMQPQFHACNHPATPLLEQYARDGCPVDCGEQWSKEDIIATMLRGPHISATAKAAVRQLREETEDKIKHGYARVVKWKNIKNNIPPQLKVSPVAMIPHKSKKYRCILDLSWSLFHKGRKIHSVNDTTNRLAKAEAMVQLGLSIKRIISVMAATWSEEKPFLFAKLDIKDGFWRMAVGDEAAWNFCYVLPSLKKEVPLDEIELVVPNSLQMGWCESPPFFCSGTETARDIIHEMSSSPTISLPPHRFEKIMMQQLPAPSPHAPATHIKSPFNIEVFVDDFIGMIQTSNSSEILKLTRSLLHGIHSIFPPTSITHHNGFDPISEKKLEKGEGTWEHTKEVLGWMLDGQRGTLQLPVPKCQKICTLIRKINKKKRISLKKFQQLAGKLQHASFGIPGGKGLFSPLQMAMAGNPDFINLTPLIKQTLQDWRCIIHFMEKHPTSVLQLTIDYPSYLGYSDACRLGAGGVWCSGTEHIHPFLWQVEWPKDIQTSLVTDKNPNGTVTINDLELAGAVLNWLALESQPHISLQNKHVGTYCDNTSAVAWAYKLRTSKSLIAAKLLRMLSLRIHSCQASGLTPLNIAGENNVMADIVSRAFKSGKYFTASSNLTTYFDSHFPLPQKGFWKEFLFPPRLLSRVISCLRGKQLPMESLLRLPKLVKNTGKHGPHMQQHAKLTPSLNTQTTSEEILSSMPLLHGSGQVRTVEDLKSEFKESLMPFQPSARPSNWLENIVPSTGKTVNHTTSVQPGSSKDIDEKTHQLSHN